VRADTAAPSGEAETILRSRADDLARVPTAGADGSTASVILDLGGPRVAVPVHRVRSVAGPGPVAEVPLAGHLLVGARILGGEVVAVADLGPALGSPSDAPAATRWVVVLDAGGAPLGVLADRISSMDVDLEAAADIGSSNSLVRRVTADGVLVLDVDAVLADARFTASAGADRAPSPPPPTKGPP
jgi:chemotaxis signal transduction protein